MIHQPIPTDRISQGIIDLMQKETAKIVEEEAKLAATRVEERVRGLTGQIATRVASYVSFESNRNQLTITVKLPEHS